MEVSCWEASSPGIRVLEGHPKTTVPGLEGDVALHPGNGNPLQYSCLKNPTDRGTWWATVHGLQRVRHNWATEHSHIHVALHRDQLSGDSGWNPRQGGTSCFAWLKPVCFSSWWGSREVTVLPAADRKHTGGSCLEEVPSRSSGWWTWPWWVSNSVSVALPAPWRPPGTSPREAPSSPPLYTLHFPLSLKNIHIHQLSLCDLLLSRLWHSFDSLSWGFLSFF